MYSFLGTTNSALLPATITNPLFQATAPPAISAAGPAKLRKPRKAREAQKGGRAAYWEKSSDEGFEADSGNDDGPPSEYSAQTSEEDEDFVAQKDMKIHKQLDMLKTYVPPAQKEKKAKKKESPPSKISCPRCLYEFDPKRQQTGSPLVTQYENQNFLIFEWKHPTGFLSVVEPDFIRLAAQCKTLSQLTAQLSKYERFKHFYAVFERAANKIHVFHFNKPSMTLDSDVDHVWTALKMIRPPPAPQLGKQAEPKLRPPSAPRKPPKKTKTVMASAVKKRMNTRSLPTRLLARPK